MKFQKIIDWARFQQNNQAYPGIPDIESLLEAIGITSYSCGDVDIWERTTEDMCEVFLIGWTCTDRTVGWSLIFLKDHPLTLCYQGARKASPYFYWIPDEKCSPQQRLFKWYVDNVLEPSIIDNHNYFPPLDSQNNQDADGEVELAQMLPMSITVNDLTTNVFDAVAKKKSCKTTTLE